MFRFRHALISCALLAGCIPAGPPVRGERFVPVGHSAASPGHPSSSGRARPPGRPASTRPDAPRLKRLPNGHYRVNKPWTVQLHGRRWVVPAGYSTNGITGPSWLRKRLGNGVDHPETWAAVFHDWLFTQPGISRSQADKMFYDLLIAYGVPPAKASLMHSGVSAYSASKALR